MKNLATLLALPASLLSLLATSHAQEWPYNLPRTVKYYPEHEELVRKELAAKEKLSWQKPVGMRKMSNDDGEKFFLHYWDFGEAEAVNESIPLLAPIAPIAPHTSFGERFFSRSLFARAFKCPGDSHSCSSIGSDLCCEPDQTCINTGNGVGCCPKGETCGDTIGDCTGGYHSCPNSTNGGCCIPGSVCKGTGCVVYGTYTVTTTLPTKTKTTGISTITTSGHTSTEFETTALEKTTTETVVITGPGQTTTTTVTVTSASTCASGFHSCPASLGGGCCTSGQQCHSTGCPDTSSTTSTTSTAQASQPYRPTSQAPTTRSTLSANAHCPANYYLCSAYYIGCCKIERDCAVLSCPPSASTILETGGVTIVESASTSVRGATCHTGWFSCATSESGGCCPSGYQCGTASCVETKGGIIVSSPKEAPSSAVSLTLAWGMLVLGVVAGAGMVVL